MNRKDLVSGREFFARALRINAALSMPALAIVLGCMVALLDLGADMWKSFSMGMAVYLVVGTPVNLWVNRRIMAPIIEWLDADAPGARHTEAAYVATLAFPQRMMLSAIASWTVPSVLVAGGLSIAHPGLWTWWETAVEVVGGLAAGVSVGVMTRFLVKGQVFDDVREAVARAVGSAEQRARLAPKMSIRTKVLVHVTGCSLVPLVFATIVALDQGTASLERFGNGWMAQVAAALPQDGDPEAIARIQEQLASDLLPAPVALVRLADGADGLPARLVRHVEAAVASGQVSGDGRTAQAGNRFHWRKLGDGSVWVAAVPDGAVFAHGATSTLLIFALVGCSMVFAPLFSYFLARDLSSPIVVLREAAERLASGDLRPGHLVDSEDELGDLARWFHRMTESLRATIARVASSADGLEARAGSLGPVCRTLSEATLNQEESTRRAAESMEQINAQVGGIAQSSQALNESIEESSSSILELGASGEELNETASLLSSKVDEVSVSIEEMVRSVKQVSENTEALSSAAEETSASMEEMASSLRDVDASVAEAARLSQSVVERAEIGRAKVRETIAGMEAIREATETAEEVIRSLHGRAVEIGAIVDVIDDVADETNLLALNAAIIAAQSGEHGRAFGVVAEEIKDLAERVLTSTKEIGALIRSVQDEASKATGAIERGSASVASGVDLSAEAGMALEAITAASQQSGMRIGGIVTALREQAKAAGHVVELMERVRGGVDEIRQATAEQNRGNVVVFEGSVAMREVAMQVRGTTEEQARGSRRIRESVESVREAVERINAALQEQSHACAAAAEFLEGVRGRSGMHEEASRTLDDVARDLLTQAEGLREEVRRFQI